MKLEGPLTKKFASRHFLMTVNVYISFGRLDYSWWKMDFWRCDHATKHPQCKPLARSQSLIPEGLIFIPLYVGLRYKYQKTLIIGSDALTKLLEQLVLQKHCISQYRCYIFEQRWTRRTWWIFLVWDWWGIVTRTTWDAGREVAIYATSSTYSISRNSYTHLRHGPVLSLTQSRLFFFQLEGLENAEE